MVVKDLQVGEYGIFHFINSYSPFTFFTPEEITYMDIMFRGLYGNRNLSPLVHEITNSGINNESMLLLGSTLSLKYNHKWNETYRIISDEIVLDDVNLLETETVTDSEVDTNITSNDTTRSNLDKVSAYNDDIMVDDGLKENTEINQISSNKNKDKNKTKEKLTKGKSKSSLYTKISGVGFLKYNVLLDTIYSDTLSEIASLIY